MILEFTANSHAYRVGADGSAARVRKGVDFANAASPTLTPTQGRMPLALVRSDSGIDRKTLAVRCLSPRDRESADPLELIRQHVNGLREALQCPGLVRSRGGTYFPDATVRQIRETDPVPTVEDLYEIARSSPSESILLNADRLFPQARNSSASTEIGEIVFARSDGRSGVLGHAAGPLDPETVRHFVMPPGSRNRN